MLRSSSARFLAFALALVVPNAIAACADFRRGGDGAVTVPDAALDGTIPGDAAPGQDAPVGSDAPFDAPFDAGANDAGSTDATDARVDGDASVEGGSTGLDPAVTLPDLSEPSCTQPGNPAECGGVRACRLATPDSGRCDDCNPAGRCGHLIKTACSGSLDCDVDLQCFRGKCTLFCTLPTGPECGKPGICVDVGHITLGLCDPAQL